MRLGDGRSRRRHLPRPPRHRRGLLVPALLVLLLFLLLLVVGLGVVLDKGGGLGGRDTGVGGGVTQG